MAKQKEETEKEKRDRETAENNAKLQKESDEHLARHQKYLEKMAKKARKS